MGKKNRPTVAPPQAHAPAASLEAQAQADLQARRFRKARDAFKLLCKQDRAKYLPGLIEANRGLAEELMAKGQLSEAAQVIAYLKTIAPRADLLRMDVLAARHAQDWPRAFRFALDWWTEAQGGLAPSDRTIVADTLVLAFPDLDAADTAVPEPLRADLVAILEALRALSEERFAEAQDALRPVPRGSLFADWKMLVKGWLAFHGDDREKAAPLLDAVPPDSVPRRAAAALRPFLGPVREVSVARTCQLLGEPALGPILVRADQLWRASQPWESWQEMRRAKGFPSEQPDVHGVLSDFYLAVHPAMSDEVTNRYIGGLIQMGMKGAFKSPAERRLVCRMLGSDALQNLVPEAGERWWREFLDACPPDDPSTPRIAATVLTHLGHWMAQPDDLDPLAAPGTPGLRDAAGAVDNLKESIERDSDYLPAYLELLKVYEHEGQTRERNRLLETMSKRFPEDKAVLLQAGARALDQGAYQDGLDLLLRAHARDQLDPQTLLELVRGYVLLGHRQYGKRELAGARETFARLKTYATREAIDFERGLDMIQARQAALEMVFGEEAAGWELLAAARAATRAPALLLLSAHVVYRTARSSPPREGPFWKELKAQRAGTAAERALLVEVLDHAHALNGKLDWKAEETFVRECLAPVAGADFTRDEAAKLHRVLKGRPTFDKFLKELVRAGLRHDPSDPRFRILKELGINRRNQWVDRFKLSFLRDEAAHRGDDMAVALASEILDRPPPSLESAPGDDGWSTLDEELDSDDAVLADNLYDLAGMVGLSRREYDEMKKMAVEMSDKQFARFRQKCAKDVTLATFDLLFGTRGATPQPARRPPSQLDLF